jgi:ABC-2 type transport system ATP-binding protein
MAILIKALSKRYRQSLKSGLMAVSKLDLSVSQGEIFGFLGPNGAGKSTVIKILMNFIRPSSGQATINGLSVQDPMVRHSIGYLPENPFFYDQLTSEEILQFGGAAAKVSRTILADRVDQLLNRLNLLPVKKQRLRTYSKGMLQRVGLALAMVHDPDICILDEPMSGLDPLGRRLVAELILEMQTKGKTVFFSSHILSDIERLCDRVGILNRGKLLYCGGIGDLMTSSNCLEDAFIRLIEEDERENYVTDLAVG